jgi:hypothetical protein
MISASHAENVLAIPRNRQAIEATRIVRGARAIPAERLK